MMSSHSPMTDEQVHASIRKLVNRSGYVGNWSATHYKGRGEWELSTVYPLPHQGTVSDRLEYVCKMFANYGLVLVVTSKIENGVWIASFQGCRGKRNSGTYMDFLKSLRSNRPAQHSAVVVKPTADWMTGNDLPYAIKFKTESRAGQAQGRYQEIVNKFHLERVK